ncbi:hypothetical protein PoB_000312000 [Plakobranchus ocellatus]|uniref:Uncharacterized protein n=1 Tax=Plakobranchus ocellatus TaxID=259542 RepID=A0AAV3Y1R3_9GAST|nr:hypothetical protein PoB_000312000 [Plakobranchus ocellatus]
MHGKARANIVNSCLISSLMGQVVKTMKLTNMRVHVRGTPVHKGSAVTSLVTKILPVVAELKEAFDAYKDMQEDMETGSVAGLSTPQPGPSGLEATLVQSPQPGADDVASQPGTVTVSSHLEADPLPQASASSIPSKHTSIAALQHLTGVIKTGQIQLNQELADSLHKVLVHGLDQETRSNLDTDIKLPSNCNRLGVLGCNPEIYKQASMEIKARTGPGNKIKSRHGH